MPYSTHKNGFQHNPKLGTGKCSCGQTFKYVSTRDLNMKLRMHHKFCSNPPKSFKTDCLRKLGHWENYIAMMLKGSKESISNIYPTWINITNSEHNQEAALYPQVSTSALLIQ